MTNCIGVRFRRSGRIYFFKPNNEEIKLGDGCIVETIRGIEYGTIVKKDLEVNESKLKNPLKEIIRVATEDDIKKHMENKEKEPEAFIKCKECIKKHNLPMKLLGCEYTFDATKVLFYFSADNRIDFRELVKDLASIFKIRIELRQVGVRDETKILGGIGACGRSFCCTTFLYDFKPVSIKNVKEQGVSLNPSKISGVCGRLMCCLNNEQEAYEELNRKMPEINDIVDTVDGLKGEVKSLNTIRQKVKVLVFLNNDDKELREYDIKDLKFKKRERKNYDNDVVMDEELAALQKEDINADL